MSLRAVVLTLLLLLAVPATAAASPADEQRQGQDLAARLQAGTTTCDQLSASDFDHIGEYVMGRALGSTSVHQAMNDRMRLMLGDQGEQRMHELMGRRFAGCLAGGSGAPMGPGMMGRGDWNTMMGSGDWNWMMGSAWRSMSRQDWQRLQRHWLATSAGATHEGRRAWVSAAIVLGALFATGLVVAGALAAARRSKRPPAAHTP